MRFRPATGRFLVSLIALLMLCGIVTEAYGAKRKRPVRRPAKRKMVVPKGPSFQSALIIDAESGRILFQKDPHASRAPASLAKMMLELVTLEAIRAGEISLYDPVVVPEDVKKIRGTRVRLKVGETVTVRDLLAATAIASANDAATVLAIHLDGSTEACVERMNRRARELGMLETRYANVHGLDRSGEPGNITTAWDLAILARHMLTLPEVLEISSTIETTIREQNQRIHTTNRLVGRFPGADGLKTGYTSRAGYCLVTTAEREGMRLISVLLGARSNSRRFSESAELLTKAFTDWKRVQILAKGDDLGEDLAVREGTADSVRLIAGSDLHVIVPSRYAGEIRVAVNAPASTRAPITEGWTLGRVQVMLGDSVAAECAAIADKTVRRAGVLDGFLDLFNR